MNAGTIEPLDCTPAAEEVADRIHALVIELLGCGYALADLIDGAEIHLQAMRRAARSPAARH